MGKRGTELRKDFNGRQMPSLLSLSPPLLLLMHTKQYHYIRHWIPVDIQVEVEVEIFCKCVFQVV